MRILIINLLLITNIIIYPLNAHASYTKSSDPDSSKKTYTLSKNRVFSSSHEDVEAVLTAADLLRAKYPSLAIRLSKVAKKLEKQHEAE